MVQASCPGCGSLITFKIGSSVVLVCEFCRSVVARGDRTLEDLGKVAYLVGTDSLLSVGLHGRYREEPFELTGRTQFSHEAGDVWNEWYAAFPDGRWGWLTEARGHFYLTFQRPLPNLRALDPFDTLTLGALLIALPTPVPLSVTEKGIARAVSAEGEIPYHLIPGVEHQYADLSDPNGEFATLDYGGESPRLFVGREVDFAELGFALNEAFSPTRTVKAQQLLCPHCASALSLRVPDKTERATCPSCGSLLDITCGNLKFLRVLDQKVPSVISLGTVGHLNEYPPLTVIGFLQRSIESDGIRYFWEEYLLYAPAVGFRWLVRNDDHWNFVCPVPSAKVTVSSLRDAFYDKRKFKRYQDAVTRVEYVWGEFYWRVEVGEIVETTDYVSPPFMLSRAASSSINVTDGDIHWSLGSYLTPGMVEKAFALRNPPAPRKIAPNQPYPHRKIYQHWLQLLLIALGLGFIFLFLQANHRALQQNFRLEIGKGSEESVVRFSEPFVLNLYQNVEVAVSTIDNSWLDIVGDLINQQTDEAQGFSLAPDYYHGSELGEAWIEGEQSARVYLSAPEAGVYLLGLDVRWNNQNTQPVTLTVTVTQGVARAGHLILTMLALSVIPLFVVIRHVNFTRRRWSNSVYNPYDPGDSR